MESPSPTREIKNYLKESLYYSNMDINRQTSVMKYVLNSDVGKMKTKLILMRLI